MLQVLELFHFPEMILVINLFWYQDHKLQDIISQLQIEVDNQDKQRQGDKRGRVRKRNNFDQKRNKLTKTKKTQRKTKFENWERK
jgi:hypothetical protein